jgi:uncharacterized protein (DUF4415 family)
MHARVPNVRGAGQMNGTDKEPAILGSDRLEEPITPPMSAQEWTRPVSAASPHKISVGMRLDRDLIAWFKAQGPGYQTRINAVLRQYVEAQAGRK